MRRHVAKLRLIYSNSHGLFLFFTLFIFSLLRTPSLIEPSWYGDEGIYQVIGIALRQGRILYGQIWDNKPPLLYLIYTLARGDLFFVRLLSFLVGAASIVVFFMVAKKLFRSELSIYASTLFYALFFGLPILEGNIANAENFMHLPILASVLFLFLFHKTKVVKYLIFSGLILSVAFLLKIVAVFDFFALFLFLLVATYEWQSVLFFLQRHIFSARMRKRLWEVGRPGILFTASFIAPIVIVSLFFLFHGIFPDYFRAVFSQNVGYVGHGNYLFFPMGKLIFKMLILGIFLFLTILFRRRFHEGLLFIIVWVVFSLFSALFSERPYTHYLLVLLPAFSLLFGNLFESKKFLPITTIVLLGTCLIVIKNFSVYTKIVPYYQNYLRFVFGNSSFEEYIRFFDRASVRDYEIARFLRVNTENQDSIFLWTDSGQIYALSNKLPPGRYIVAYHITFYEDAVLETQKALEAKKPKFIVSTKDSPYLERFVRGYILRYKIRDANIYEKGF